MDNAIAFAEEIVCDAELRGMSANDVFIAFAGALATRNATLAGRLLISIGDAIRQQPITKVITPPAAVEAEH